MEVIEQCIPVVLFILSHRVIPNFEFAEDILEGLGSVFCDEGLVFCST